MNAKQIQLMSRCAVTALTLLALTACDPFAKEKAEHAERTRIECLDKICYGDVAPKFDHLNEALLKLNGQWYLGPKEYFSTGNPVSGFEWWEHKPISRGMKRPPEMQALAVDGKGYDFSIEIFLTGRQSWPTPNVEKPWEARGWEAQFEKLQRDGFKISRQQVRPDLEVVTFVKADGTPYNTTFYIATKQKIFAALTYLVFPVCRSRKPAAQVTFGRTMFTHGCAFTSNTLQTGQPFIKKLFAFSISPRKFDHESNLGQVF